MDHKISEFTYKIYKNHNEQTKISFFFNETLSELTIFDENANKDSIAFDDILGSEIRENGCVTGGVGRAIAGGILAGGVGAIVGSTSANEMLTSFQLIKKNP